MSSTRRRLALLGLGLGLGLWLCLGPSSHASTGGDQALADDLEERGFGGIGIASRVDLHASTERFVDGTKGHRIDIAFERVFPEPPDDSHLSDDEAMAWASYCAATAIVVATHVDSTGLLTRSKRMIFTRSRYRVDAILKPAPGVAVGAEIDVVRPGGTVIDDGETLRVVYNGERPPIVGARYLLELNAFRDAKLASVHAAHAVPVDDRSRPLHLAWGYERATVEALRDGMTRVVQATPCIRDGAGHRAGTW